MKRREFCTGIGSAFVLSSIRGSTGQALAQTSTPAEMDPDPRGGYTPVPPKQFLFTDFRHIQPGDLGWRGLDGKSIPVAGPPMPPVPAVADAGGMPYGIRLVTQPATRQGPFPGLPNVLVYHEGMYRSWRVGAVYPTGSDLGSYTVAPAKALEVSYGESKDGYEWKWRKVSEVSLPNIKIPNNGLPNISGIDGDGFFIDPHGPAEERYKIIFHALLLGDISGYWKQYQKVHPRYRDTRLSEKSLNGMFGLVSPDGVNWKAIPEPLMIHKGDTDNTAYYDEWLGKYVMYTRLYWLERRMIARAESDDFRHWTPVQPIVRPSLSDAPSNDVYLNGRTCYPGLPEHHLMFAELYRRYTQTAEIHLMSSLDGIAWDRIPGGPVMTPSDPGKWDSEYLCAGKNLVPLGNDKIGIPYVGLNHPHKYPRWPGVISAGAGWATWPKGRLVALVADEVGEFRTFVIKVTGTQLKVNIQAHRAGEIRIGVRGFADRSVDLCDPLYGDELAKTVTWKGNSDLSKAKGKDIVLQFKLRAAKLFGFEWV